MEKFMIILMGVPVNSILRGWVLCTLWKWFLVPSVGLPPIRIPYALGISLIIGLFTMNPYVKAEDNHKGVAESFFIGLFVSLFALLMGWVFHLFV